MCEYYDEVYRQVLKELLNKHTRSSDPEEEKICEFCWAIVTRERYAIATGLAKRIEYEVIEDKSIVCGMNRIKQRTYFIKVQIDIYKLLNSYYLLEQTGRLTFNCVAQLFTTSSAKNRRRQNRCTSVCTKSLKVDSGRKIPLSLSLEYPSN